jgi:ATP-dependent RNA helicase DHX8/PRP22
MKDVDQTNGLDLQAHNPGRDHIENNNSEFVQPLSKKPIARLSSPERWEIKQLIAAGVLNKKDYPHIDEDTGTLNYEEREEDLDIELRDEEPQFLKGQTKLSVALSPVKIVKNPDGSMNRAALQGAALAKER